VHLPELVSSVGAIVELPAETQLHDESFIPRTFNQARQARPGMAQNRLGRLVDGHHAVQERADQRAARPEAISDTIGVVKQEEAPMCQLRPLVQCLRHLDKSEGGKVD